MSWPRQIGSRPPVQLAARPLEESGDDFVVSTQDAEGNEFCLH